MHYQLADNSYGKSRIRVVRVARLPGRHALTDLTVHVRFSGDFERVHTEGDNRLVLPTDTMKNTVYAFAKTHPIHPIEAFGLVLSDHFLASSRAVSKIEIDLSEQGWVRLTIGERPQADAFLRASAERRTATIARTRERAWVRSGIEDTMVMKTSRSAFEGYLKDAYTTLRETHDRLFATKLSATWSYASVDVQFDVLWEGVRQVLLETFAEHDSLSVQHTLYAMAAAVLEAYQDISEIRLSLPNIHHLPVDLSPFGLQNENEVFVATDEPYGLIEATVRRAEGSKPKVES